MTALPVQPEVEASLVAKLLVDPSAIPTLVGRLEASDFHDGNLGRAWAVMESHAGDARRVDATTLKAAGVDIGDPLDFLSRATSAPVEEYARIVRTDAAKRSALTALKSAERIIRDAKDESGIHTAVQSAVTTVLGQHRGGGLYALGDLVAEHRPGAGGIPWGLSALDRAIQPVRGSDLIVIAARANVGKSALSMEMALALAKGSRYPVMFTSIEMSKDQLVERLAQRAGGLEQFRDGYNIFIHDDPGATTSSVRSAASLLKIRHGGVKAIFVDYLQILKDPGTPQHERVANISGRLKQTAREFDIPVFAMSQLNRQSEIESRKPRLSDLRDSGAIEQDADIVFLLWRKERSSPWMLLIVAKNRHGRAGVEVTLNFDLESVSVDQ